MSMPPALIPRFRTDSVGRDQRGSGNRRYHDDEDAGLDTGDMLEKNCGGTDAKETGGSLFDRLQPGRGVLILSTP